MLIHCFSAENDVGLCLLLAVDFEKRDRICSKSFSFHSQHLQHRSLALITWCLRVHWSVLKELLPLVSWISNFDFRGYPIFLYFERETSHATTT
jgi:hypothetical protein